MNVPSASQQKFTPLTVTVEDLSKRFNREWIFRHLHYKFSSGTTYAVTGPNGSGKSTLLQVLWGQVPQTSGSIRYEINGTEIPVDNFFRNVSIATPYMELIEEFTLREILDFHFKLKPIRPGLTPDQLPAIMYLEAALDKQLINFSSGMRQRLKLGLALYTQADVYFLDEPSTNLDRRAFEWYRNQLDALPGSPMVLIASNNPQEYPENAMSLHIMDFKR